MRFREMFALLGVAAVAFDELRKSRFMTMSNYVRNDNDFLARAIFPQPPPPPPPAIVVQQPTNDSINNISSILKVYVYKDMPAEFSTDIEQCWSDMWLGRPGGPPPNFQGDVPIIRLFKSYPGRVYDPSQADLFVVPYPHAMHCMCAPGWISDSCKHVRPNTIKRMLGGIKYLNDARYESKHLFVFHMGYGTANTMLRRRYFHLTNGPTTSHNNSIVIPYVQMSDSDQPSQIRSRPKEWWIRDRKYALAMLAGKENKKMIGGGRFMRKYFLEDVERNWGQNNSSIKTLGGMPILTRSNATADRTQIYEDSIFCPVLPGDNPIQKRFFDVILRGCIPVMPHFKRLNTWFIPKRPVNKQDTHPFWKKTSNEDSYNIDYESFVVQVELNETDPFDVGGPIRRTLSDLLEHPDKIRTMQENMAKAAPLLTYGLHNESHQYEDAFSTMLRNVKAFLDANKTQSLQANSRAKVKVVY